VEIGSGRILVYASQERNHDVDLLIYLLEFALMYIRGRTAGSTHGVVYKCAIE
jgi:hypothetical protein